MSISHFDLIANLLAEENLTVIRKSIKTAQFDIQKRTLTLPVWRYMSPPLEGMLISHEVGHALFTNMGDWLEEIKAHKNSTAIHSYFNIIEDVRIERLMKRRYPGIRKTFYFGYQEAMANDIFKLTDVNVSSLALIDRINLFFKVGSFVTIPFNANERMYLKRAETVETVEEAYTFALELYEYAKATKEESKHPESDVEYIVFAPKPDDEDDEDSDVSSTLNTSENDDSDDDSDDEPDDEPDDDSDDEPDDDSDILPITNDEFDSAIIGMIDEYSNRNTVYYTLKNTYSDPIIGYKQVCNDMVNVIENRKQNNWNFDYNAELSKYIAFMEQSNRSVAYMVKEFEMRKAATAYARTQVSKSGSLNMNKVFAYKINDDLFKRVVKVANGKNHGMIMLVDWSSSMDSIIHNVIEQVINLSMFCRRINIPFEVYAFTSQYPSNNVKMNIYANDGPTLYTKKYDLLNIFSSKMNEAEFNSVAKAMWLGQPYNNHYSYVLYDTPLNDALVHMVDFIPQYLKQNGVEKLTFITLSDGESRPLANNISISSYSVNYILDTVSKKTYKFRGNTVPTLLKIIKDRYNVTCLGFDILDKHTNAATTVYKRDLDRVVSMEETWKFNGEINKNGFVTITDGSWDALFAILPKKLTIDDVELGKIGAKASVASIAKQFGNAVSSSKNSRVMLGQFVGYIA